jgi:hypothetical protein
MSNAEKRAAFGDIVSATQKADSLRRMLLISNAAWIAVAAVLLKKHHRGQ